MGQTETSKVIVMADNREWWESVDPSKLDEETRYRLLQYAVSKHGRKRVYSEIGISRITMWRLLERKSPVKPEYIKSLLKSLTQKILRRLLVLETSLEY